MERPAASPLPFEILANAHRLHLSKAAHVHVVGGLDEIGLAAGQTTGNIAWRMRYTWHQHTSCTWTVVRERLEARELG